VGKRLALAALAVEYGQKIEYSGPTFAGLTVEGNRVRLTFTHAAGLKTTDGKPPHKFALCGADGLWYAADATIEGEQVVLTSDKVPAPVAVRYAWANNPEVNLVNRAGLPAVAFRTDKP
jgi:sialate O-acetylesterase